MSESSICEICGGAKNLNLPKLKTSRGMPVTPVIPPELRTARVCLGHHESKHDGKLDEKGNAEVWFTKGLSIPTPYVHIGDRDETIVIDAKQALSLLSWLEQERANLTALAEGI